MKLFYVHAIGVDDVNHVIPYVSQALLPVFEMNGFRYSGELFANALNIHLSFLLLFSFQQRVKRKGNRCKADKIGSLIISGIFCLTVINILAASFTTTTTIVTTSPQKKSTSLTSDSNIDNNRS